jgi:hypothetical protein
MSNKTAKKFRKLHRQSAMLLAGDDLKKEAMKIYKAKEFYKKAFIFTLSLSILTILFVIYWKVV